MTSDATFLRPASWSSALKLRVGRLLVVPDLVLVAIAVVFAYPLTSPPLSGDYGQWLMVSRFYSGETVPAYRDMLAIAPLVPALLAAIRVPIADPVLALSVLRLGIFVGFVLGCYAVAGCFFRSRSAGVLAVALVVTLTDRFLELLAFGGILQLASLAFMLAGLAALARAAVSERHERAWWIAGAGAMALSVLSHTGSVVIVIPVSVACGLLVLAKNWKRRSPLEWFLFLEPAMILPILAVAYWVVILVPANQGYADNPATASYRGVDRLFDGLLLRDTFTIALLLLGPVSIAQGVVREMWGRRIGGYSLVAAWAATTWGVLGFFLLADTPTDYPRFAAPLLAPLAVGAAGAIADGIRAFVGGIEGNPDRSWRADAALLGIVGVLLLFGGRQHAAAFARQTNSYALGERESIEALSEVIKGQLPQDQTVLVLEPRAGKWIEGLTGHDTLFANKTRYSFRDYEWERSVAADAMIRSATAMVNGLVSAKFMWADSPPRGEDLPREFLFGVNHDGEWLDLLRLPENGATVTLENGASVKFSSMRPVTQHRSETQEGVTLQTMWTGSAAGEAVAWTRTITLWPDSAVVDVVDEITSGVPVREVRLEIAPFASGMAAEPSSDGAIVRFPKMGRRQPEVAVRLLDPASQLEIQPDRLALYAPGATRVHTQLEARTAGSAISSLALLNPHQLMEDYRIGAAVLRVDGAFESRLRRLQALGLCEATTAGSYVLLTLDCGEQDTSSSGRGPSAGPSNESGSGAGGGP